MRFQGGLGNFLVKRLEVGLPPKKKKLWFLLDDDKPYY